MDKLSKTVLAEALLVLLLLQLISFSRSQLMGARRLAPENADELSDGINLSLLNRLVGVGRRKPTNEGTAPETAQPHSQSASNREASELDDSLSEGLDTSLLINTVTDDGPETTAETSGEDSDRVIIEAQASSGRDVDKDQLADESRKSSCDSPEADNRCRDYNAVCVADQCVCKPGYFSHRLTDGHCRPIKSWLNNCDNDDQCQAFNPNLRCDTSLDRFFCNCIEGYYFDVEDNTCVACMPPQIEHTSLNDSSTRKDHGSTNSTAEQLVLPLCKESDMANRFNSIRRDIFLSYSSSQDLQQHKSNKYFGSSYFYSHSLTSSSNTSDPFRIKTPIEVFMGAIILFTLFTVTWFFLQRMIHDCRSIMRSLRNPEYASNCTDLNFTVGPLTTLTTNRDGVTTANHLSDSNATSQAIARIIANEAYGSHLTDLYRRDLAGVLVQHLTGNLPASLSGHAITFNPDALSSDHEPNLYPLAISAQHVRSAALPGAASQLILSPSNRAITILRSPAFEDQLTADFGQLNPLTEPPPPKYEEAMANAQVHQNFGVQVTEVQGRENEPNERNSASETEANATSPNPQSDVSINRDENDERSNPSNMRSDTDSAQNRT